jgi:hypothetical protein
MLVTMASGPSGLLLGASGLMEPWFGVFTVTHNDVAP